MYTTVFQSANSMISLNNEQRYHCSAENNLHHGTTV